MKEIETYCSKWLSDSVNRTVDDLAYIYTNASKDDLKVLFTNIYDLTPERFQPYNKDGSRPIPIIKNDMTTKDLIRNLYSYYSKYDHFGQMFLLLSEQTPDVKLEMIAKGLKAFTRSLFFNISFLSIIAPNNKYLVAKVLHVNNYLSL